MKIITVVGFKMLMVSLKKVLSF